MSDKRYYWLKLKRDFFKRHDIQIIEDMPNGKEYILFYLKLLCESVDHDGNLRFSEQIPYNENMLATITRTNVDIVRAAIQVFTGLNMMEILDDGTYFMGEVHKMLGSAADNDNANRQRRFRERRKELALCERYASVTESNESKSIEKEKDKEIEIEPPKSPKGDNEETVNIPFKGALLDAFNDWLAYKAEKRQPYKPRGLKSLITQVQRYADQFGDFATANAILDSMASNYQGIVFDRLERTQNAKPSQQRKTAKAAGEYKGDDFIDYMTGGTSGA